LIVDLSRLNCFHRVPRFKMSVATAIQPKDWAVSLDLRDAYFHIPMHPDYQHFLRFSHEVKVYQFQALPFGLVMAPLIFHNYRQGFRGSIPRSWAKAAFLPRRLVVPLPVPHDTQKAAYPAPTEGPPGRMGGERRQVRAGSIFVGVRFHTAEGRMSPAQDRIVKIRDLVRQWRHRSSFLCSWGCSTRRQIKCLRAACTCASYSSHSGAPTRTHWSGRSGARGPLGSGISGPRRSGSVTRFHWPLQPQKCRCSRTPPSMDGVPSGHRGSVREGHVDRGGVSSLHQHFGDEGCHFWLAVHPETVVAYIRRRGGGDTFGHFVMSDVQPVSALLPAGDQT
jgi:hypothetical protein